MSKKGFHSPNEQTGTHCNVHTSASGSCLQAEAHWSKEPPCSEHHDSDTPSHSPYVESHSPPACSHDSPVEDCGVHPATNKAMASTPIMMNKGRFTVYHLLIRDRKDDDL